MKICAALPLPVFNLDFFISPQGVLSFENIFIPASRLVFVMQFPYPLVNINLVPSFSFNVEEASVLTFGWGRETPPSHQNMRIWFGLSTQSTPKLLYQRCRECYMSSGLMKPSYTPWDSVYNACDLVKSVKTDNFFSHVRYGFCHHPTVE